MARKPGRGGKGDVKGQKKRWRQRQRDARRALYESMGLGPRGVGGGQWTFDGPDGPNLCRSCGGVISDRALYCATVACNPTMRAKRHRILSR